MHGRGRRSGGNHRRAIEMGGCEEIDAVISPAETTGEFRHRHDFKAGDTELGECRKFAQGSIPAPFRA